MCVGVLVLVFIQHWHPSDQEIRRLLTEHAFTVSPYTLTQATVMYRPAWAGYTDTHVRWISKF